MNAERGIVRRLPTPGGTDPVTDGLDSAFLCHHAFDGEARHHGDENQQSDSAIVSKKPEPLSL